MTKYAFNGVAYRCSGLLTLAVLIAGCAGLRPVETEGGNTYILEATPLATIAREARDIVLEVSPVRASPGFETAEMVYVQRPYELGYFGANRWADTPSRMLGPLLAQALEQSGGFRAVVQAPSVVPADVRVVSELLRLQQNFETRPSRLEIALRVQLVDVRGKRVLATRVFDATDYAPSDDPYGGVRAAQAALQRILGQFVDFCVAETGKR